MSKILLALQFWDGDKAEAMETARLIADLQPNHTDEYDFLFAARFDCEHDQKTVDHVSRKFNVHTFVNKNRRGVGWPFGCNELFFGTMDWVYSHRLADQLPEYKAVLAFESDACPMSPDWLTQLRSEWDAASAKVVGALQSQPDQHINGNALFSADSEFLKWLAREVGGGPPHVGWDWFLAKQFEKRGWKDSPKMKSFWQTKSCSNDLFQELNKRSVSFVHGVKDDSLRKLVREKFLTR